MSYPNMQPRRPVAPTSTTTHSGPAPQGAIDALCNALAAERALIDELIAVVLRQRAAVAVDDLQGVDDTVFATHRLLLTLGEARKQRRAINQLLGCNEETGVKHLTDALGSWMTPQLRSERDALQDGARQLSREIEINRRILREALANSESFVRAMRGAPLEAAQQGYGTPAPVAYSQSNVAAFSRTA